VSPKRPPAPWDDLTPKQAYEEGARRERASSRNGRGVNDEEQTRRKIRWSDDERERIKREKAASAQLLPPERDSYALSSYLDEPDSPLIVRIDGLQYKDENALLIAQHKTGKSTLVAHLAKALADGTPFLGKFEVKSPENQIGIWNLEMTERAQKRYLRATGIEHADRIELRNLRGHRVDLLSDVGFEWAVEWLQDHAIDYWAIDSWARLCRWAGVNENDPGEVLALAAQIDAIKLDAGVGETLITHHTGWHGDHARGATTLPDWADDLWTHRRGRSTYDQRQRYLTAVGREIEELSDGAVDLIDGVPTWRDMDLGEHQLAAAMDAGEQIIRSRPGIMKTALRSALQCDNGIKTEVIDALAELPTVRVEHLNKKSSKFWPADEVPI
jgi:hypothetical protein